ncbi:MAG: L-threonylcarbamoyladenylate synthase, partial [Thermoplasmata archaeon]
MATTILAVSIGTKFVLDAKALDRIREVLASGGLLVYPTDTAYGIGADPFQEQAVDRLYDLKGRPRDQPVSMAVADIPEIFRFGERTPIGEAFCAKNLPGPYTVVLRATPQAPRPIVSKDGRIALRIPAHPIPRLLAKARGPITATSANLHGLPSPETCEEARLQLGDRVDLYLDGGMTPLGGESTVVELTGARAKILRRGRAGA